MHRRHRTLACPLWPDETGVAPASCDQQSTNTVAARKRGLDNPTNPPPSATDQGPLPVEGRRVRQCAYHEQLTHGAKHHRKRAPPYACAARVEGSEAGEWEVGDCARSPVPMVGGLARSPSAPPPAGGRQFEKTNAVAIATRGPTAADTPPPAPFPLGPLPHSRRKGAKHGRLPCGGDHLSPPWIVNGHGRRFRGKAVHAATTAECGRGAWRCPPTRTPPTRPCGTGGPVVHRRVVAWPPERPPHAAVTGRRRTTVGRGHRLHPDLHHPPGRRTSCVELRGMTEGVCACGSLNGGQAPPPSAGRVALDLSLCRALPVAAATGPSRPLPLSIDVDCERSPVGSKAPHVLAATRTAGGRDMQMVSDAAEFSLFATQKTRCKSTLGL